MLAIYVTTDFIFYFSAGVVVDILVHLAVFGWNLKITTSKDKHVTKMTTNQLKISAESIP
jgi:hypothetical protein